MLIRGRLTAWCCVGTLSIAPPMVAGMSAVDVRHGHSLDPRHAHYFYLALDGTRVVGPHTGGASGCSIVAAGYRMDVGSIDGVVGLLPLHTDGCRSRWGINSAIWCL